MKKLVQITLAITLELDASMEEDDITTLVRASLPDAFGNPLTDVKNPVDIIGTLVVGLGHD